jgi:hypothetical protein
LPDQTIAAAVVAANLIDLWHYASDAETAVNDLTYTILAVSDSHLNATVDQNRYVSLAPAAGWLGVAEVTVQVSDPGGLSSSGTFAVAAVNTPPALATLPLQLLRVNSSRFQAIDLWRYATDSQTAGSQLTYTIESVSAAAAGVSLADNRAIHIQPALGWIGQAEVTIRVTDPEGLYALGSFPVIVAAELFDAFLPATQR